MKIALVQSPLAWGELQENLQNFDKKMAEGEDCDVILLPEMFTSGCMMIKKSQRWHLPLRNLSQMHILS